LLCIGICDFDFSFAHTLLRRSSSLWLGHRCKCQLVFRIFLFFLFIVLQLPTTGSTIVVSSAFSFLVSPTLCSSQVPSVYHRSIRLSRRHRRSEICSGCGHSASLARRLTVDMTSSCCARQATGASTRLQARKSFMTNRLR